ncbi:MAG TPA: twin-arginine translocase subunit TatC [Solirubrobacteraceae bacterium]|jgi:sec-independent protein translocase protein TatC|nr:twin-arginine translocase subunit TatC [Solirubrobacteraceae bacterium]
MATAIRTIGHEDRLSLVEHLEELRTRLIVSGAVLAVAFGVCMWQNHALLHLIGRPLAHETQAQVRNGEGPVGQTAQAQQGVIKVAKDTEALARLLSAPDAKLPPAVRTQIAALIPSLRADVAKIPAEPQGNKLTTLGVGEPFTTTLTVVFFFALIVSLPVILFELYGFVLPALAPSERRAVAPLLLAVPFLFAAGVLFGYFVVLPSALRFLVNFNSSEFNILVQAGPYYQFAATVLLAMGLFFQIPVAILGATRAGLVTPSQLRRGRRYALVACAAVAAFLPGDAITLLLETIPLYFLYEASILVASFVARRWPISDRSARDKAQAPAAAAGSPPPEEPSSPGGSGPPVAPAGGPSGPPPGVDADEETDPSVNAIIDHIDSELSD